MKKTTLTFLCSLFASVALTSCEPDYITDGTTSGFNITVMNGSLAGTQFTNSSDLNKIAYHNLVDDKKVYVMTATSLKSSVIINIANFEDKQFSTSNTINITDLITKTRYQSLGGAGKWSFTDIKEGSVTELGLYPLKGTFSFEGKFRIIDFSGKVLQEATDLKGKIVF